ncbi:toll/interleukin-1 receptor domain-containing protein [Brevibacillus nitrificans]|uniref:Toll/interleukin-1 receptor domain-containing protein n=1 Tax=Brevibacillus nitrificans TaxID=651560 RepID=A0A3M8D722_9BACL|nr:TIR domain-containing protein [Brevibacillus nitrificans]RNB83197.1 toll/interleukin-1 receptor domain-containing protein [Brevibacillus nitrificans]
MSSNKGIIINGGNFNITNMVSGDQVINYGTPNEKVKEEQNVKYDVVFSFAGENRELVREVATILISKNVDVFYDEVEQILLWGKDLKDHFKRVFGSSGRLCILFMSKYYLQKSWCQYELGIIKIHKNCSDGEYILPIILDDTPLPDGMENLAHLDGIGNTSEQLADFIFQKIYLKMKSNY